MQRHNPRVAAPVWTGLLWGLALLGLLVLPSDYRAGAQTAHAHALIHLWVDASDGAVQHHHETGWQGVAVDWLDPSVAEVDEAGSRHLGESRLDVGEQQDSIPVGGVHLLLRSVVVFALAAARFVPVTAPSRSPQGRVVRVLLPPPRWTPLAG